MNSSNKEFPLPSFVENYRTFNDSRGSFNVFTKIDVPDGTKELYGTEWAGWNFQTNISVSKPRVLRGMHWQKNFPQGKLVKVLYGKVLDVVIDIRPKSPTFKQAFSYTLANDGKQLFVPRGFAHGFLNIGDTDAIFHYNVDNIYSPENERGIKWNSIDFDWPLLKEEEPILSVKDSMYPGINDISFEEF